MTEQLYSEETMVGRIAVIDGQNIIGHVRHGAYKPGKKLCPSEQSLKGVTQATLVLQLKRETLAECKIGHLSGHFSHQDDVTGRNMVIWCTGSGGGFQKAFYGTVERVSSNTELQYALRLERKASPNECYTY